MGFLLGAFGKLAAGARYRSIQAKMMRVRSKLRRVTREVSNAEKMISRQEKYLTNYATLAGNMQKQGAMDVLMTPEIQNILGKLGGQGATVGENNGLTAEEKQLYSQYLMKQQETTYKSEMWSTQVKQQIAEQIESMRDQLLEPLKDEEDLLQGEQDSLQSELEIAKQDYESCKEMEKNDAKMLKPEYTAQS